MKPFFVALILLVALPALIGRAQTQNSSGGHSFLLRLPTTVDTTGLQISYFMTGDFGGVGDYVLTKPNVHEYVIDGSYESKPARTLKVIVYCPGYGIQLLNISSLADPSARSAFVELKPLPSVRLSGRIVLPTGRNSPDFEMDVWYLAIWGHKFFGIADGAITMFKIASVDVTQDGSFSMTFSDFASDPAVASFEEKGWLSLRARDPKTGNTIYTLERAGSPRRDAEVEIAAKYDQLVLYAGPPR